MLRFPKRKGKLPVFNGCLAAPCVWRPFGEARALLRLGKLRQPGRRGGRSRRFRFGRQLRQLEIRQRPRRLLEWRRRRTRDRLAILRGGRRDDSRGRRGAMAENAERDARGEKDGGQDRRCSRHEIGGAAPGHKTAAPRRCQARPLPTSGAGSRRPWWPRP